jgi:DNA-binding transcriptional ArsR family regulator
MVLAVLSYPVRLELLGLLRFPHTLSELRLAPHRPAPGAETRIASRQSIHTHLAKLEDADLVRRRVVEQGGRKVPQFVVNPTRLYAVLEDLRRLSTIYAGKGLASDVTGTLPAEEHGEEPRGPRLVLVHGVYEGKWFPLDARLAQDGRWPIGRKRGLAVSLDYDPFVSLEHAVVAPRGGDFVVTDLPSSKNGTAVNWRQLPPGGSRVLRPGDVVGVGRSLLCFAPR